MRKKLPVQNDRREFLKKTILGSTVALSNPMRLLLASLFVQTINKAEAVVTAPGQDADFNFVNFHFEGSPLRIAFDKFLRPNGTDPFVPNPMIGTTFSGGNLSYQMASGQTEYNGYFFPLMWAGTVPTPTGYAPMRNLAPNMLSINYDIAIDSHSVNQARVVRPLAGGVSISGLVADAASTPIPAVRYASAANQGENNGQGISFGSNKGLAELFINGNDPLTQALGSFSGGSSQVELSTAGLEAAIDSLLTSLKTESTSEHQYSPSGLYDTRKSSLTLMKRNFGNLVTTFTTLRDKYQNLISKSVTGNFTGFAGVPGMEDVAAPGSSSDNGWNVWFAGTNQTQTRYSGPNFNNAFTASTKITALAESFAVAEYLLAQRISSSINLRIGGLESMTFDGLTYVVGNTNPGGITNDMHGIGGKAIAVAMTKYFRAFAASMLELKTQLGNVSLSNGKTLWQHTVVALNTEFGRHPRNDQCGTDHMPDASVTSIFSGMITKAEVVGNTLSTPNPGAAAIASNASGTYGTIGEAAPVAANNNRPLGIGNVVSTICHLLNVQTPTPNDSAVGFKDASGVFQRSFPKATGT